MIRIIADENIPFLKGILEPFARLEYIKGDRISHKDLLDADGLIVRTRTRCDAELLHGTRVKFIATATIGIDHIDTKYCQSHGIAWHHAPGCNSSSVRQYIAAALAHMALDRKLSLRGKVIGIIGVGHVGGKVAHLARLLGMVPLLNDPPRESKEGKAGFSDLDEILANADIVTLHVPLTLAGQYKTFHLADEKFLLRLGNKPLLINTSRGEVADSGAVFHAIRSGCISGYVSDVWENEPLVNPELLYASEIATPHIAGYSVEGKANGTAACVRAASKHYGFGIDDWHPQTLPPPPNPVIVVRNAGKADEQSIYSTILSSYDIMKDDAALRSCLSCFEELRNSYPVRREFEAYDVKLEEHLPELAQKLERLGFKTDPSLYSGAS